MYNLIDLSKKIRIHALNMTSLGSSSHICSVFSIADILSVLYGSFLVISPNKPNDDSRDRFILSKGHAGAGVYAALSEVGFFSKELLKTHYKNGSYLSGHVSHKGIPGVEFSTGSLGHGLPVGVGIAIAGKLNNKNYRTVVILSDGECDEGSNWEAILNAAHNNLNRLIAIIDYNKLQSLDTIKNTLELEPFAEKWKSFGWHVIEIDGHNHSQIESALNYKSENKPLCIIANTIKGKGVSFMENNVIWHYKTAKDNDYKLALAELLNK
jgi:transketolase